MPFYKDDAMVSLHRASHNSVIPEVGIAMNIDDLAPELREKAKACKTPEDVLAVAKEAGYKLTDEELEAVSSGDWSCWSICSKFVKDPKCSMHGFVC